MTAKLVLKAEPGQKVGLSNGLRPVCDKRNGSRYFELRKRVRGRDPYGRFCSVFFIQSGRTPTFPLTTHNGPSAALQV